MNMKFGLPNVGKYIMMDGRLADPVWDDGEEYDYALRLVGCFCKKEINDQKLCDSFKA